ncbi:MAG: hypothetical protein K8L99_13750 [Anaerolineae bacterium]|nr:hypothetical protein [Anaerolineae bacterium]
MPQIIVRLAFWLTALALIPVLVIRARAYDDSALLQVVTPPDGCYAPCFMGVIPGGTRADEALALLRAHDWVESVERGTTIRWTWSGRQPDVIASDTPGQFSILSTFDRPLVASVYIVTQLTYGDLLLALGEPDHGYIAVDHRRQGTYIYYRSIYENWRFQARLLPLKWECPFRPLEIYEVPVRIEMGLVNELNAPDFLMSFDPKQGNNLIRSLRHVGSC